MIENPTGRLERFYTIAGLAVSILFILVCLHLSAADSTLWFDGAYSLAMVNHSWNEILEITGRDFHPPLYYFILKAGQVLLGNDVFSARLVSVVPVFLLFIFVRKFLVQHFGSYSFLLFSLAFGASATVMLYTLEIRMYSYALFFVSMTCISAFNAVKTDSNAWYFALFFFFLATFYTQYYSGILVGIGYIFLAVYTFRFNKGRVRTITGIGLLSFILYLPWLSVLFHQLSSASNDFVIQSFRYSEILTYGISFFESGNLLNTFILFSVFSTSLLAFLFKKSKTFVDYFFFYAILSIAVLIAFGVILSITVRPLFMPRYLAPACGLIWLFFAIQVTLNLKNLSIRNAFIIVLFLVDVSLFTTMAQQPKPEGYLKFQNYLGERIQKDDILIISAPESSGLLVGVIAHLFPGYKMAITHDKALLSENHTLNYHVSPFDMNIIRYRDIADFPETRKWLLIPYNAKDKDPEEFARPEEIKYLGNFGWSGYLSGNQFDLYEILPESNL